MFCNTFDSLAVKKHSYYKITLLNQHMKVSAYIILLNYCNVKHDNGRCRFLSWCRRFNASNSLVGDDMMVRVIDSGAAYKMRFMVGWKELK